MEKLKFLLEMGKPSWGMGLVTPFRTWLHKWWSGDLRRNREVLLPSKNSPRAAGWCASAALLMGVQAIGNGRVPEAQAVLWHRTQVQHCILGTAVYMISHSFLVGLVCTLKIEFIGQCTWEKMTNNWQLFALPRWSFQIFISSSPCFLESKHQTSPKGTPMPRNRPLDATEWKHPRWCRNALHGSQEPDSYLFCSLQALTTQLHWNQQECLQRKVLHTQGEDHNLTFWSLSYCRTGNFRESNLLAKPEDPHNPSALNNLENYRVSLGVAFPVPTAVTAPGSSSQENCWGSLPQPEAALLPLSCCSISSEGSCGPETGRISPTNNGAPTSSPSWELWHTASLSDPKFG